MPKANEVSYCGCFRSPRRYIRDDVVVSYGDNRRLRKPSTEKRWLAGLLATKSTVSPG